jgi:hypothetical protein
MDKWTIKMVEERLVEAASVMRRLPPVRIPGFAWPWKAICWRFGVVRATAYRRYQYGLSVIAWPLNGRTLPAKRGRGFLIKQLGLDCPSRCWGGHR